MFNGRSKITEVAYLRPSNSAELIEILNLELESELPEFLRGWALDLSWATNTSWNKEGKPPPYNIAPRWCFARERGEKSTRVNLDATVLFNRANVLDDTLKARLGIRPDVERVAPTRTRKPGPN